MKRTVTHANGGNEVMKPSNWMSAGLEAVRSKPVDRSDTEPDEECLKI